MASKNTAQKVGIWIIAITMLVGTIGTYFLFILANENDQRQAQEQQEELRELQEEQERLQERMALPAEPLPGYKAKPFDEDVTSLEKEDLKKGEGKEVTSSSEVTVNYFGWLSDGEIFDSTNRGGEVEPIDLPIDGVIEGWQEGLVGAKEGTVRKLYVPSDMGYGPQGSASIPPDAPLAFIIEIVEVKE